MSDIARDRNAEAQTLHDEEIADASSGIAADESEFEGYDEEQRAEAVATEQTDPFARDVVTNLLPDEDGDAGDRGLPDKDPVNDPGEDDI